MLQFVIIVFLLASINNYTVSQSLNKKPHHGPNAHRVFISPTHNLNGYANIEEENHPNNAIDENRRRIFEQQIVVNRFNTSFQLRYATSTPNYTNGSNLHEFNDTLNQDNQQISAREDTSSPLRDNYGNGRVNTNNNQNANGDHNLRTPVFYQNEMSGLNSNQNMIRNKQEANFENGDRKNDHLPHYNPSTTVLNGRKFRSDNSEQIYQDERNFQEGFPALSYNQRFPERQNVYQNKFPYQKEEIKTDHRNSHFSQLSKPYGYDDSNEDESDYFSDSEHEVHGKHITEFNTQHFAPHENIREYEPGSLFSSFHEHNDKSRSEYQPHYSNENIPLHHEYNEGVEVEEPHQESRYDFHWRQLERENAPNYPPPPYWINEEDKY